jgi:similar to stage IV sporulation protein
MRNHVLLELPDVSWLVVNVKGCTAHVQVVERQRPPQIVQEDEITNMVASRSGLVTRVEPLDGKAQVSMGSTVTEGQLLISGVVDSTRTGMRLVHGMGNVWARTWYDLSVLVPLQEVQHTAQEAKTTRIWLDFGKKQINLLAKGSMLGADCGKITHYGAVCLPGGFRLPITVVREQTVRYDACVTERREAEARAEGEATLLQLLESRMTEDGTVTSTRFSSARKGNYLLVTLRAECHEQIAQQVVLPQP